jgi:hypothetical protein
MVRPVVVFALMSALLWFVPAGAEAAEPPRGGDPARTVRELSAAARAGDAEAELALGTAYREGNGVAPDAGQAYKWIRKAAEQDLAEAQFEVGAMEEDGEGTEENAADAAGWYRKAAEHGYVPAMFALGELYRTGHGVTEDGAAAAGWYRSAAERDDIDSLLALGDLYRQGSAVEKNLDVAAAWYRRAAELGSPEGRTSLALLLSHGEPGRAAAHAPSRGEVEAMDWLTAAADQGYAPAQYYLAMAELNGIDATLDAAGAIELLERAADQGHAESLRELGLLYEQGQLVPQDQVRALMYFDLAARLGDQAASGDRDELANGLAPALQQLARRRASEWLQTHGLS